MLITTSKNPNLNFFLGPANRPKPNFLLTITNHNDKQQILKFKKLGPANVWYFCLIYY